jgi:hypothetical protein
MPSRVGALIVVRYGVSEKSYRARKRAADRLCQRVSLMRKLDQYLGVGAWTA